MRTHYKEQPSLLFIVVMITILILVNCLTAKSQTTLFSEDFEGTTTSWQFNTNSGGSDNYWAVSNGTCSNGSNILMVRRNTNACVYRRNRANDVTAQRQVVSSGYENLTLSFDWIGGGESGRDYGRVYYSFDGNTWTLLTDGGASGIYQGSTNWALQAAFSLPSILNDTTFYIGFNWINDNNNSGTYPAFGVDNITVQGTVMPVAPPPAPSYGIFSEDFSGGALPSGWTRTDLTGNNAGNWSFNNPGNRTINTTSSANGFAIFDSDAIGQDNKAESAELVTPAFDCSAYSQVSLAMEHYFRFYANSDYRVSISGDNGASYTTLVFDSTETANAETLNFDISSYAAGMSQVRLKFSYKGHWSYYWAIDDILVEGLISDSAVWTGAVSTNWNLAGNWSTNNIPSIATSILIPSSAVRMPTVASNTGAACFNLTLQSGATLTVETDSTQGGSLTISGDLYLNGTIVHTGSNFVKLSGSGKSISGDYTYGSNDKKWEFTSGSSYTLSGDLETFGIKIASGATLDMNGFDISVYSFQQEGNLSLGSGTLEIGGDATVLTEAALDAGTGTIYFNAGGSNWASKGLVNQNIPSVTYYNLDVRTNNGFTATLGNSGTFTVLNDLTISNPGTTGGSITTGSEGLILGNLNLGAVGNNGFTFNVAHRISGGGSASAIVFYGSTSTSHINVQYTNATLAALGNFDATTAFGFPVSYTGAGTQMVMPGTYNDNLNIASTGSKALGNNVIVNGNLNISSGTLTTAVSMRVEKVSTSADVAVSYLNNGVATNNTAPTLASLVANASSMGINVPAAYAGYSIVGCGITIPHTYNADLDIYLVSPSGTVYVLSTDNGGNGDGYLAATFSDAGSTTYPNNSVLNGNYRPEGFTFSGIVGATNGIWTLYAIDDADQDVGTITDFTIQLQSSTAFANIEAKGNWVNTGGTFTPGTATVTLSGTSQQTITSNSQSFYNLTVVNPAGALLNSDVTVSNVLTLTQGVVSTGYNRVILTNNNNTSLAGYSNTAFVNGNLRRYIGFNTQAYVFPVGNGTGTGNYRPAELTNNLLLGVSYIDASFGPLANHNDAELNVTEGGTSYSRINPAGVWTIEPNSQPTLGSYSMKLFVNGFSGLADNEFVILKRPVGSTSGADWSTGGGLLDILGGLGRLVSDGFALRSGLTSFSEFGIGDGNSGGSSLPIELLSFEANLNDRAEVELDWATALEINNDYFTVERSADGIEFEEILQVPGAGNTSIMHTYTALDAEPLSGLSYYRLKQTDFDGTYTYSKLAAVNLQKVGAEASMIVYPNPSFGNINVQAKGVLGMVSIMVTDMQGRTIYLQHLKIEEEGQPVALDLESMLTSGYYQVTMIGSGIKLVEKIIIQ